MTSIKQLLAHPSYYQKYSFSKEEYSKIIEVSNKVVFLGGIAALFVVVPVDTIQLYSNIVNLVRMKSNIKDYEISRHEFVVAARRDLQSHIECNYHIRKMWDGLPVNSPMPPIKLKRNKPEKTSEPGDFCHSMERLY